MVNKWILLLAFLFAWTISLSAQRSDPNLLHDLLYKSDHSIVKRVLAAPDSFHAQIIFEEITRNAKGKARFKRYAYNLQPGYYFYPASTVKMANAVVALEKLHDLGLSPHLTFHTDSVRYPQRSVRVDSTAMGRIPTIAHYVDMVFVVSDNEASNRLYEFIGQDELHERLKKHGFRDTRITHRLADFRFDPEANRYTNPVYLLDGADTVYVQPERYAKSRDPLKVKGLSRGLAYYDIKDSLITGPFDFSRKNYFPLAEQIDMVKSIMFPEDVPKKRRFNLPSESYDLIRNAMYRLPRESEHPVFDTVEYYDSYCKFLLFGDSNARIPDHFRIYNKVGWAYGFLTDAAYVVDTKNGVEFLMAATIEANTEQIFNDNEYEYKSIGNPFLAEVGRIVYGYVLRQGHFDSAQ